MAKGKDQIETLVASVLQPGEELIVSAKVNYNGSVPSNLITLNAGVSAIDASAEHPPIDPDAIFAFPTANQMLLALTGGRIFAWSLGVTGKPKQFVGEVPTSAIASLDTGDHHYGEMMRIHMKSGTIVDLEFMRGEPAEDFCRELRALVGG